MNIITKSTTKAEIIEIVKDIIWKNQGIDSYTLLTKLIELGYKFESTRKFKDLIYDSSITNIMLPSRHDKMAICKPLQLEAQVISLDKRVNCYNCLMIVDISDNSDLRILTDDEDNSDDKQYYCGLNPTMRVKLGIGIIPRECPINIAIEKQMSNNKEESSS